MSTVEHDILRDALDAVTAARIVRRVSFGRDDSALKPGEAIVWMDQVEYEPQSGRSAVVHADISIAWAPQGVWSELQYHEQLAVLDAAVIGALSDYGASPTIARVIKEAGGTYIVLREYRIVYHRDMLDVSGVIRAEV